TQHRPDRARQKRGKEQREPPPQAAGRGITQGTASAEERAAQSSNNGANHRANTDEFLMRQLAGGTAATAMVSAAVESSRAMKAAPASVTASAASFVVHGDAVGKKRMGSIGLKIVHSGTGANAFEL